MAMAMAEVTTVPYMGASAPNWSVTGFQISRATNENPKWDKAGHAPRNSDTATPPKINNTNSAAISVAERNILS
jgi:hypothetical protein